MEITLVDAARVSNEGDLVLVALRRNEIGAFHFLCYVP